MRLHRGVVTAHGWHFADGLLPEEERRRRVVALAGRGVRVMRTPCGILVWGERAVECDCASAPGAPMVLRDGVLSALAEPVAAPPGSVVVGRGGELVVVASSALAGVDVSEWLDLDGWRALPAASLGAPPPLPLPDADDVPVPGLIEVPSEERDRMLASWNEKARSAAEASGGVLGWILERMRRGRAGGEADGLFSGLARAAQSHIGDRHIADRVARLQSQYIRKMLDLFRRGDLGAALRHALPLDDAREHRFATPLLGVPTPRERLEIRVDRPRSLRSLGVPPACLEEARKAYRRAFEQLHREGRIDEAAYVLAELLHDIEGAVALLENGGQARLAAELAEARRLPPGLVVRQWCLAGDVPRAVRIARRTGAFADAVRRLEQQDRGAADRLRFLWATTLAESGDHEAAVRAGWTLQGLHEDGTIDRWIDRVVDEGGPPGARMLILAMTSDRERGATRRATRLREALALLGDDRDLVTPSREALVDALIHASPSSDETVVLARAAVRTVVREQPRGRFLLDGRTFGRLVEEARDPVLRADLPPYVETAPPSLLVRPHVPELALDASGTAPVFDAALLPNGRLLAALGEAGARILTADGRTVAHFDHPCHRLVLSDAGSRAIAIGLRGSVQRLARIDLGERRASRWCEASLEAWADEYDGSQWFVACPSGEGRGEVVAVDALGTGFATLSSIARVAGRTVSIARSGGTCAFVIAADTLPLSLWCGWHTMNGQFDERAAENRLPTPLWLPTGGIAVGPDGGAALLSNDVSAREGMYGRAALKSRAADRWMEVFLRGPHDLDRVLGRAAAPPGWDEGGWSALEGPPPPPWSSEGCEPRPVASHDFVAGVLKVGGGMVCTLINRTLYGEALRIYLRGARHASVRLGRRHLVIGDSSGRIAAIDVRNGKMTHQICIRF
jgi:hypothetical protein